MRSSFIVVAFFLAAQSPTHRSSISDEAADHLQYVRRLDLSLKLNKSVRMDLFHGGSCLIVCD